MESKPIKVLVAEDKDYLRRTLGRIFSDARYAVKLAADGAEALTMFQGAQQTNGGIDILFTDVEMPNMNGVVLAETIRREHPKSTCPIYFVTGGIPSLTPAEATLYDQLLADGRVQGVIEKPFVPKELWSTVYKHYPQSL